MGVLIFLPKVAGQYRLFRESNEFFQKNVMFQRLVVCFANGFRRARLVHRFGVYNIFERGLADNGEPGGATVGSHRRAGTGSSFNRTSFATAAVSGAHLGYSCVLLFSGFGWKINSLRKRGCM